MDDWTCLGIDPAPSKPTVICRGDASFEVVEARRLRGRVEQLVADAERIIIAWDAPLSFDRSNGYSDRPIDKRARSWPDRPASVSALPFSGCPHWAITNDVLGLPFGEPRLGLQMVSSPEDADRCVIEVHPAVAVACWWGQANTNTALPRYKAGRGVNRATAQRNLEYVVLKLPFQVPATAVVDDDHFDAWIAQKLAAGFVRGSAKWAGTPQAGGYVLPMPIPDYLHDEVDKVRVRQTRPNDNPSQRHPSSLPPSSSSGTKKQR